MAVAGKDSPYLENECRHLHFCLFIREAPEKLVREYVRAHAELATLRDIPAEEDATLRKIVRKRLNAAAIEPWLRRKGSRHALTRKLMLVAYLAESGGGHAEFLHAPTGRAAGWGAMLLAGAKGAGALAVGYAEKILHGLV